MGVEYVKLSKSEKFQGNQNLLHSQLQFLNTIRNFEKQQELRGKEFILKISLKNKIAEAMALVAKLESFLPKSTYKLEQEEKSVEKKLVSSGLESEIEMIRKKIERLQKEM